MLIFFYNFYYWVLVICTNIYSTFNTNVVWWKNIHAISSISSSGSIYSVIWFTLRSTPCPNVKHGDEWGEPSNCDSGDNCAYCHTRTEQQFHPEIYKSTKCNDVQQAGYCPRGAFCAFAHVDRKCRVLEQNPFKFYIFQSVR